jgi:hypothetical protein
MPTPVLPKSYRDFSTHLSGCCVSDYSGRSWHLDWRCSIVTPGSGACAMALGHSGIGYRGNSMAGRQRAVRVLCQQSGRIHQDVRSTGRRRSPTDVVFHFEHRGSCRRADQCGNGTANRLGHHRFAERAVGTTRRIRRRYGGTDRRIRQGTYGFRKPRPIASRSEPRHQPYQQTGQNHIGTGNLWAETCGRRR